MDLLLHVAIVAPMETFSADIPGGVYTPLGMLCLVLAFPYLQMARGKLHPQTTIDRMAAEHKSMIDRMASEHERQISDSNHDRDEWRAAHRISETARQVGSDQVAELLEHARTTDQFIRALPHPDPEVRP